ncbi:MULTISPECIES: nitrilase family protein [unclassified Pseudomonas]|uniref:nitrilase family protein n=1 Tax=Pseudomonas TaxID=286 RepID=UPI000871246E|nr:MULTISPECIES: nitrilase family protein [unclassified Pseudomonas]SCW27607.1 Predicted amidohydrolase [Pseudomonas sp. NFACC56-3]SFK09345.1 Predicted amidohydrolase [Pseudomonas sp. NFACC52]
MSAFRSSDETQEFPSITVAAIQMEPRVGCKAENLKVSLHLIAEAASAGAQIVVLPELVSSGYVFSSREEAFELAESVPAGISAQAWEDAARQHNVYVIGGVAERVGYKLYNAAVMVGPEGYVGTYRKLHLWGDEHLYFEVGDLGLPVFHTLFGRLAMIICYDGWFPEVYRLLAMQGADIVCMPTNWVPMPGQGNGTMIMANTLAMANAHVNGLNIICANRVGTERGQLFVGNSIIVGADGWPLVAPGSADNQQILYADINLKTSRQSRRLTTFNTVLRDRRTDIYDPMLGTGWQLPRY